jgi:hypothetical protein
LISDRLGSWHLRLLSLCSRKHKLLVLCKMYAKSDSANNYRTPYAAKGNSTTNDHALKASLTTSSRSSGLGLEFPIEVDSEHYEGHIPLMPSNFNRQRLYADTCMCIHPTAHKLISGTGRIYSPISEFYCPQIQYPRLQRDSIMQKEGSSCILPVSFAEAVHTAGVQRRFLLLGLNH